MAEPAERILILMEEDELKNHDGSPIDPDDVAPDADEPGDEELDESLKEFVHKGRPKKDEVDERPPYNHGRTSARRPAEGSDV